MSIVRTYSVFCDGKDGDNPCVQWVAETVEGVAAARRVARAEGWQTGRRDLCPDHRTRPGKAGGDDA